MTTTPGRAARRAGWLLLVLLAALLLPARPVAAHAFLAGTDPTQGERLPQPPEVLSLQFSEAVALPDVELTLRRAGGDAVDLPDPELRNSGLVVQVTLPDLGEAVYVVEWQAISAVDGHGSAGEFAFAVGDVEGTIPATAGQDEGSTGTPATTAATWLVFAGLAAAAGGLTSRQAATARPGGGFLRRAAQTLGRSPAPGRGAAGGAAPGSRSRRIAPAASLSRALVADRRRIAPGPGGAPSGPLGPSPHVWVQLGSLAALTGVTLRIWLDGGLTQPGGPVLAGVAFLLALAVPVARLHPVWPAAALLGAALVGWASRSHGATDGLLGWLLDLSHLAVAVAWAGALAYLVATAWRWRRGEQAGLLAAARTYARTATWLVVLLVVTGGAAALRLLGPLESLWTTTYGWLLLAKITLLGVALALALTARSRGLGHARPGLLRRLTSSEAATVTLALVLAAVLVHAPPPGLATTTESLLGPPPLQGPIARAAGLAGTLMLDVRAGGQRLDLLARSPEGPVPNTGVHVTARYPDHPNTEVQLHPRPCGDGCFTQHLALPRGTTLLQVNAAAPDWAGGSVKLALHWPPPAEQPDRFTEMLAVMRAQPDILVAETVTSDTTKPHPASDPADGVRMTGEAFIAGMPYAGGGVVDVRPLPEEPGGFSFYLPGSRSLFTAWTDRAGRLTRARIVNPGHEVQQRFTYPQAPAPVPSRP